MDKHFKIKITDERTGESKILTLDPRRPMEPQLSDKSTPATGGKNYLHFIASPERDYETATLHAVVRAVVAVFGGSLVWEISSDRPPAETETTPEIQAYLTINTKRYD